MRAESRSIWGVRGQRQRVPGFVGRRLQGSSRARILAATPSSPFNPFQNTAETADTKDKPMAAVPSASTAVHAPQHKRRDCSTCTMTVHDRVTWPLSRRFYPARPARGTASHTLSGSWCAGRQTCTCCPTRRAKFCGTVEVHARRYHAATRIDAGTRGGDGAWDTQVRLFTSGSRVWTKCTYISARLQGSWRT